jgi:hypothetical protein
VINVTTACYRVQSWSAIGVGGSFTLLGWPINSVKRSEDIAYFDTSVVGCPKFDTNFLGGWWPHLSVVVLDKSCLYVIHHS